MTGKIYVDKTSDFKAYLDQQFNPDMLILVNKITTTAENGFIESILMSILTVVKQSDLFWNIIFKSHPNITELRLNCKMSFRCTEFGKQAILPCF